MTQTRFLPRLTTAVLVALGIFIVWGVAVIWLMAVCESNFSAPSPGQQRIFVEQSGRPLIMTANYGQIQSESYRTLDGQLVVDNKLRQRELYPAQLSDPKQYTRSYWPEQWGWRLSHASDLREFPGSTSWFMVKIGEQMYLEGYDDASRRQVGFIGRQGYRPSLPNRDEWFTVRGKESLHTQIKGASVGVIGNASYLEEGTSPVVPWRLYALDGNRLAEIDLRERTVRTLLTDVDAMSIAIISRAVEVPVDGIPVDGDADGDADDGMGAGQLEQLVLRLPDRLQFYNPKSGERVDFVLPERVRTQKYFSVHGLPGDEILIQLGEPFSGLQRRVELVRLDRTGRELETNTVELTGFVPKTVRRLAYEGVAFGPMPLGWAVFAGIVQPLADTYQGRGTYSETLAAFNTQIWPALVLVAILGIASAWAVHRWQRSYRRDHTTAWTVAALLLGPPLVLVYFLEYRGEPISKCASCGRTVPRAREACAACGGAFPTPALIGTEVFA